MDYLKVFMNSLMITVASNILIVVFCSMAAYMLVRTKKENQQYHLHDVCSGDGNSISIDYDSVSQGGREFLAYLTAFGD
ncbi:hypothetical protein GCM10020331_040010 [Ectobacillus funiculus]